MIDTQVVATHSFTTAPPLDVLIVPGGIGEATLLEHNDRAIEDFIAARFESTEYILSVCTGASFLARSGILNGKRATANKAVWKTATAWGENITWVPSARWVEDGKVWTSSGVSAGMDMMVAFLRRVYGDARVNGVVNGAEYLANVDASWDPFSVIHEVGFFFFSFLFFPFSFFSFYPFYHAFPCFFAPLSSTVCSLPLVTLSLLPAFPLVFFLSSCNTRSCYPFIFFALQHRGVSCVFAPHDGVTINQIADTLIKPRCPART